MKLFATDDVAQSPVNLSAKAVLDSRSRSDFQPHSVSVSVVGREIGAPAERCTEFKIEVGQIDGEEADQHFNFEMIEPSTQS
jgi:hypothetical protein